MGRLPAVQIGWRVVKKIIRKKPLPAVRKASRQASCADSPLIAQLEELIVTSLGGPEATAKVAGVASTTIKAWLRGTSTPTLSYFERVLGALGYVAVLIPAGEAVQGANIRDVLTSTDRLVYDAQSGDVDDVLKSTLRLLQLRLHELEKMYSRGEVDNKDYWKQLTSLSDSIRQLLDSSARLRLVQGATGLGEAVEIVYGSPKGPQYKHYQRKLAEAREDEGDV